MSAGFGSAYVLEKIKHHSSDVTSVDFHSDRYLATGSGDKTAVIWEWKPGLGFAKKWSSPLLGHKYSVTCVRFAPSGRHLVSSSADGYSMLWDVETGQCVHSFVQSNGSGVRACCFTNDGSLLATAGEAGIVCLWEFSTRNLIKTIDGHDGESVQGISFSPDNMLLVSGDVTGSYKVWNVGSAKCDPDPVLAMVRDAHDLGINALEFSPQYQSHIDVEAMNERSYLLVTCGNDHMVIVWQVSLRHPKKSVEPVQVIQPQVVMSLQGHASAVSCVRFSPSGDLIASTSIDKTVRLWQVSTGKCVKTLEGYPRYVACCAFSSNQNLLVTGSNDKSIWVWDLTGELDLYTELKESSSALNNAQNGTASGASCHGDGSPCVKIREILYQQGGINTCHFSATHFATAGSDKMIHLWRWSDTGVKCEKILEGHRYAINQVEFAPGGNHLASCSYDGTTLIWDPIKGEVVKSGFHISSSGVRCVRFSPDWKLLATGGDDEIISLFNVDSCELIVSLEGHSEAVTCLAFSRDSQQLATGCADGHCRLYCGGSECSSKLSSWSQTPYLTLEDAHDLGVTSCDFSPVLHTQPNNTDGKYELATCGQDCLVKIWKIDASKSSASLLWKLAGHGGSVTCVRYSPQLAELIASTATDKTCRLWDSYSGECLHVLNNHEGILTCCAFSPDATLLATGSMDKTVLIWELPKDLAFQSFVASRIKSEPCMVASWSVDDVNKWLNKNNLPPANLNGATLLNSSPNVILDQLNIGNSVTRDEMRARLAALRRLDSSLDTPHELLCPITHQIMRDPVKCSDGYTYERSAIESWFKSGHNTSPMTNAEMSDVQLEPNVVLSSTINTYLAQLSQSEQ